MGRCCQQHSILPVESLEASKGEDQEASRSFIEDPSVHACSQHDALQLSSSVDVISCQLSFCNLLGDVLASSIMMLSACTTPVIHDTILVINTSS